MHDGVIALSQVEANGIRIDTEYLTTTIKAVTRKINKRTERMKSDWIYKKWKKQYGRDTNLGSRQQLGKILFTILQHPCASRTPTGKPQVDQTALEALDLPFIKDFLKVEQLKKARSTYLQGILRETVDGYLHPFFHLHIPISFRGSSSDPNFQNLPIRDPKMAALIRRAFIPRKGRQIVEIDYGGAEICNATCYHKDPRMISYIKDKTKDLHRDMAAQCYMLPKKQVLKNVRYCGKNMFVFPQFYGDYYLHCTKSMWEAITKMKLKTKDGLSLKKHLREKGITKRGKCDPEQRPRPGTFEKHLQEIEYDFWNRRFKVYGQWKKDWWESYQSTGEFTTLTGFRISGNYKRNEVINYPVQGSAFHWLLWSLIRIQKLLKKYNMRTLIVGQIHDSIVADVIKKELKNYLEIANKVMTQDIRKHWKWINVPLTIEAEASPVDGSWFEKKEIKI